MRASYFASRSTVGRWYTLRVQEVGNFADDTTISAEMDGDEPVAGFAVAGGVDDGCHVLGGLVADVTAERLVPIVDSAIFDWMWLGDKSTGLGTAASCCSTDEDHNSCRTRVASTLAADLSRPGTRS